MFVYGDVNVIAGAVSKYVLEIVASGSSIVHGDALVLDGLATDVAAL